ncbi:MAG: UDP-4-amino-4,6-dideoxy-N-acetyl-beta-L-altrosamine transaminase [Brevundimonas sp.]|jgi:UDP-4-amino-4,6-dideoxy-N-acetyl-beta-L-altrosamine transaminase|uniref:UDP-4-amino-4, 6-dideoxy-N-acetyl-beta-L-altrosamine transaminase n=1 Tax=Brevundimonas sp. TaxID=1871086 RepID=UPI004034B002
MHIPYSRQEISEEDIAAVVGVLRSDFLTQGPAIGDFEQAFARAHGAQHAIAVSNATGGLHIALLALGVTAGDRVWTSPISFVASANCALYLGAEVDFVDIDPVTRNMSIDALARKLADAETSGALPAVVIPVDFSGLACDLREMRELADHYGFRILEDASHATGARYLDDAVGSKFADISVFSFHAVKIVTTAEGGMLTTNDDNLASKLRLLRSHGITRDDAALERPSEGGWYYEQVTLGYNYRMTDMQAALGLSQLARMDTWRSRREALADRYDRALADSRFKLPARLQDRVSSWHLYVVELTDDVVASRAQVFAGLRDAGIGANVHYIPIHTQPHYERLGFERGAYPHSERYYDRAITIPLFPAMTEEQQDFVIETLKRLAV